MMCQHHIFEFPFDKAEEPRCLWPYHACRERMHANPCSKNGCGSELCSVAFLQTPIGPFPRLLNPIPKRSHSHRNAEGLMGHQVVWGEFKKKKAWQQQEEGFPRGSVSGVALWAGCQGNLRRAPSGLSNQLPRLTPQGPHFLII